MSTDGLEKSFSLVGRPLLEWGDEASSLAQQLLQLANFANVCFQSLSDLLSKPHRTERTRCEARAVTQLLVDALATVSLSARKLDEHNAAAKAEISALIADKITAGAAWDAAKVYEAASAASCACVR